jgi:hypothetical protein
VAAEVRARGLGVGDVGGVGDGEVVLLLVVLLARRRDHRAAGAHLHRDVLRLHPAGVGGVRVAGRHQRTAVGLRQLGDLQVDDAQVVEVVRLALEVPVLADPAVQLGHVVGDRRVVAAQDRARDIARHARRRDDQALVVAVEQFVVDAGLAIEAVPKRGACEQLQRAPAADVLGQQDHVVVGPEGLDVLAALAHRVDLRRRDTPRPVVGLDADDGHDADLVAGVHVVHDAREHGVLGHRQCRMTKLSRAQGTMLRRADAVEERPGTMFMKFDSHLFTATNH